jgi:AhpD family alkylhydroperoxidase
LPEHGTTIALVDADQAPLLARPYYRQGDPGPIVAALAHVPELLEVAMPFIGMALGPTAIPWRTKEIVILRTSSQLDCRYCVQSHTVVALDAGLSRAEVTALRSSEPARPEFADPADRALIAWTDELARGVGVVAKSIRSELRAHHQDAEVVELTLVVGVTMMLNRFCTSLELPTSPGVLTRLAEEGLS